MPSSPHLAMLAIALMACSSVACGQCFGTKPKAKVTPLVIPLAVRAFQPALLDKPTAEDILNRSSQLLQTEDGTGDCECPVKLELESFGLFSHADGIINTKAEFNALFQGAFSSPLHALIEDPNLAPRVRQVRVVAEIYWCRNTLSSSVAGCADEPGLRIAITRRSALLEAELWAHETGHTRGLPHRNNSWTAVMHETVYPDHKELTVPECNIYRH
jgi:hypothetical protein